MFLSLQDFYCILKSQLALPLKFRKNSGFQKGQKYQNTVWANLNFINTKVSFSLSGLEIWIKNKTVSYPMQATNFT